MTRIISTRNKNLSPNNARLAGDPLGIGVMKKENYNRLFNPKATGRTGGVNLSWLLTQGRYTGSPLRYVMLNNSNTPIAVAILKNKRNTERYLYAIAASGPRGTGSALLAKIIQNAKNNGKNRITANVVNNKGVLNFYKKFNFIHNANAKLPPNGTHPRVLYFDSKKQAEAKRKLKLENARREQNRYFTKGKNGVYYNKNGSAVPGLGNKNLESIQVNNIHNDTVRGMFRNKGLGYNSYVYFKPPSNL